MIPLPGNRMAPTTRNLADQLATIAAQLDAILASLRDDVEEIKVQVIGDGCNSEESEGDLKNTVAEEPQGSEHDLLQQLGSGIDGVNKIGGIGGISGGITDRNDVIDDGIGGADEMDDGINDGMDADEIDKIDGTGIEDWGAAKNLTANGSHDRKGRGEIGTFTERMVLRPSGLSPVVYEELVQFINEGCHLNYHDCAVVLQQVPSPLLVITTTLSRQLSALRKTPQKPGTVVVFFIIVWDPGKEIPGGPTGRKPTEGERVHTIDGSQFLPQTICRSIGLFGSPCTRGRVLNWNKLRDYNNPLKKDTTFGARCYVRAGLNSADFKQVEINEDVKATWDNYDLFKNHFPYLRLEVKLFLRAGSNDTNPRLGPTPLAAE